MRKTESPTAAQTLGRLSRSVHETKTGSGGRPGASALAYMARKPDNARGVAPARQLTPPANPESRNAPRSPGRRAKGGERSPGKRLRLWRVERDLSQADLAFVLDCSQAMVSYLERGAKSPGAELRERIREACGVEFSNSLKTKRIFPLTDGAAGDRV